MMTAEWIQSKVGISRQGRLDMSENTQKDLSDITNDTEIYQGFKELSKAFATISNCLRYANSEVASIAISARVVECNKKLPTSVRQHIELLEMENAKMLINALSEMPRDGKTPMLKFVASQYNSRSLFDEENED